jgi:integrase
MSKIDIHDFRRRLELIELSLRRQKLPRKELSKIWQFRDQMFADGLGLPRVCKYLASIKAVYNLTPWSSRRATRTQIIGILARIERAEWSAWTKHDYKLALRKYLAYCGKKDLAQLVRLPKVHGYKLPEELITWDDLLALLASTVRLHDIAFLYCLWESGARIGELLSLQRKHVSYDSQGAVLIVDGKTGMRRVRIIESAPVLDEWISSGSLKPEDAIFPNTYRAYRKRLQVLAARAGIEKRIYPHLFRHSRATFLAGYLTDAQLCAYLGWTIGSAMPRIYVHLAGHDLDAALARIPTLATIAQGPCAIRVR